MAENEHQHNEEQDEVRVAEQDVVRADSDKGEASEAHDEAREAPEGEDQAREAVVTKGSVKITTSEPGSNVDETVVTTDVQILDPNSPLAVQIPEGVGASSVGVRPQIADNFAPKP